MRPRMSGLGGCVLIAFLGSFVGCSEPYPVRQYTVAKQAPDDTLTPGPGTPTTREQPEQRRVAWFFKLLGPESAVATQAEPFARLVRSIKFGPDGKPKWSLPEGWTERAESGLRLATIEIPGEPKLEISVMSLPAMDPESSAYLLSNLNRWRGQLGLDAVEAGAGLEESRERGEVAEIATDGRKTTLVNLSGKTAETGDSRMLAAMIVQESRASALSSAPPPNDLPFTYTKPEGWKDAPVAAPGIQFAVFKAGEGDQQATMSVSTSRGETAMNVNRWRGQAGLPELSEAAINADARAIAVDGAEGKYFVVEGSERSILGVIVQRDDRQWFIKADGPKSLVQKERVNFEAFVKSIRFK